TEDEYAFTDRCDVFTRIQRQSPEIAMGVDEGGAGDQGMMFGYAAHETPELMPLPITLAHALCEAMDRAREGGTIPYLRPDGKSQVTVLYEDGRPVTVDKVVLAGPPRPEIKNEQISADLYAKIVVPLLQKYGFGVERSQLIVNGTG